MLATARIAAEHGSFSRIRQVAPRLIHGSLGTPNGISIVFAGLTVVTHTNTQGVNPYGTGGHVPQYLCEGDVHGNAPPIYCCLFYFNANIV